MVLAQFIKEWNNGSDKLPVHTSGSTGNPKLLWVEKRRMETSARMTCDFLQLREGQTALLCLPVDYIAGKMMVVRAMVQKLQLISVEPDGHPLKAVEQDIDFAAMVPLQVYNSLQNPIERERLRRIRHLIIGGSAIDSALARQLKDFPNAVWSTYGMTETLSHIALRRLNGVGAAEAYTPLPGVSISLDERECLTLYDPIVCTRPLHTNDRAELCTDETFRILGRVDNVVCSGGLKLQLEELEERLASLSCSFMLTAVPDPLLGEALTLLHEPTTAPIAQNCAKLLSRYEQPRHYFCIPRLPLTETGKPARAEAARLAQSLLKVSQSL